ncbi:Beta-galactosidase C-terminal domain [Streptomyces sp. JV185]|uniref:Beta-galactosidase C-terminal domain n=1 Tax=Streptomyces sp. JV185 TaxID=858638 RepID=UPI003FA6C9CF
MDLHDDDDRVPVELAVRRDAGSRYLFFVNRSDVPVPLPGVTGEPLIGPGTEDGLVLPPRGVAVLRQPAP